MILFRPQFNDTPSEVELMMEKTNKLCSLYSDSKILKFKTVSTDKYSLLNIVKNSNEAFSGNNFGDNNDLNFIIEEENKDEEKIDTQPVVINLGEEPEKEGHPHVHSNVHLNLNRKKHSLLKRTASEPKLAKINSGSDLISFNIETIKPSAFEVGKEIVTKGRTRTNNSIHKGKKLHVEEQDEFDSPFNELYFYTFENVLIEFLTKETGK